MDVDVLAAVGVVDGDDLSDGGVQLTAAGVASFAVAEIDGLAERELYRC